MLTLAISAALAILTRVSFCLSSKGPYLIFFWVIILCTIPFPGFCYITIIGELALKFEIDRDMPNQNQLVS
jgi:hypothetical protein